MSIINTITSAAPVFWAVTGGGKKIHDYLKDEATYARVQALVLVRAKSNVDAYLSQVKSSEETLSGEQLANLCKAYRGTKWVISNPSADSTALWDLASAKDIDNKKRAECVLNFICNKENWSHQTCEFLWERYAKGMLFDGSSKHIEDSLEATGPKITASS